MLGADTTGVSAIRSELVEGQPRVYNLYVQKHDRTGREAWISGGVLLRTRENSSFKFLSSVSDDNGGLLFVWNEVVSGTGWDIVMQQVNRNGKLGEVITSVESIGNDLTPQGDFYLFPSFPNPFNPETTIRFSLQKSAKVSVRIVTLKGQNIVTLVERFLNPGIYQAIWAGFDTQGKRMSSGLYFVQMVADNQTQVRKLLLIH